MWPSDPVLTEHKQSPCRVADPETKALSSFQANPSPLPSPSVLAAPAHPSSDPPLFCPQKPLFPFFCLVRPLLLLIYSCVHSPISPAHLLSLPVPLSGRHACVCQVGLASSSSLSLGYLGLSLCEISPWSSWLFTCLHL